MFRSFRRHNGPVSLGQRVLSLSTLASLALGFLVFLVFRFDVDLAATWETVTNANPWILVLAVLVHYTSFLFRGARWRLLLKNALGRGSVPPSVWHCSELVLLGWFANSIGGLRMGDAYRAYLYHYDRSAPFSRTAGTIVSERVLDIILVAALLASAIAFMARSNSEISWTVLTVALGLLAITQLRRIDSWLAQWEEYLLLAEVVPGGV